MQNSGASRHLPSAQHKPRALWGRMPLLAMLALTVAGISVYLWTRGPHKTQHEQPPSSAPLTPIYEAVEPELTATLSGKGPPHLLHIGIEVMARDPEAIRRFRGVEPAVCGELVMLMTDADYQALETTEGRSRLRAAMLARTRAVMDAEAGPGALISDLYFTKFILQ